ncbi:MAG: hypothetical protein U1D31_02065 [Patescibacteria group bacterium]|nr:hypothetical protein [bacterium]MDZ4240889.1 hypothetical protein [Patescibacteria group bacterium]
MRPFWQGSAFAEIIQWIVFAITLFFILLPFIVITLKRFRPTRWYHILGAYVSSFLFYYVCILLLGEVISRYLGRFEGFTYVTNAIDDGYTYAGESLLLVWPFSVFYVSGLHGRYTVLRGFISLALAVAMFFGIIWLFMNILVPWAFGQLIKYF